MPEKKYPASINVAVLKRYMNERTLEAFFSEYRENLLKSGSRRLREPDANDIRIAAHVRKTKSYSQTMKDLGIKSDYKITTAMARVAAWGK